MSFRGLRKGVVVIAIAVFLVGWVVVLPPAAAAQGGYLVYNPATHTYTVSPNGIDDTANIQAAFDACAAKAATCTIQLTKGTFYTSQIVAHEFRGTFKGMGQHYTTVEALPNLPVGVFVFEMPSAANPWPILFSFFNGTYSISDMTFLEPWAQPTVGWGGSPPMTYALFAMISITGLHATATVNHVTVIGAAGDWTSGGPFLFNMINGIFPQALLLQPGSTDFSGVIPFQVNFRVTNSAFSTIDNPLPGEDLVDSHFVLQGNTFDTTEYPVALIDMSHSVAVVSQNTARNVFYMAGVYAVQYPISTLMPCELPSQYLITGNDFQVTGLANGVVLVDLNALYGLCEPSLDVVISGNTFRTDATSAPAVYSLMTRSIVVSGNEILGATPTGVYIYGGPGVVFGNEIRGSVVGVELDATTGVLVTCNEIKDSGQWGIAIIDGSSNNLIVRNEVTNSGAFDLYWDETGTGNVWRMNEYKTSSPANLST
jgi:hypothetical protein